MALRKSLILRRLRSGRLEGRTTLVRPDFDFFTRYFAGKTRTDCANAPDHQDPQGAMFALFGRRGEPSRKRTTTPASLQLRDAGPGAVLVLLRGTAPDAARALDDAVAHNRNRPLPHYHVAALRRRDAARGRLVGPLAHLAARTT